MDKCVESDLELNKQQFLEMVYSSNHEDLDNLCLLYLLLNGKEINYIPPLPPMKNFLIKFQCLKLKKESKDRRYFLRTLFWD